MKIVFVSNYYNHHQSDLSENLCYLTDGNYYFIATRPMEEERIQMGWSQLEYPSFVKLYYRCEKEKRECLDLIESADVVILGNAPEFFVKNRLKNKKLTFCYSERIFKKPIPWYRLTFYALRELLYFHKYDNYYLLCASAYAPLDFSKIFAFRRKCFKWGYFPRFKEYDNIHKLICSKEKFSILWAARFIDWKHPEVPIMITKKLKEDGYPVHLSMIGVGPLFECIDKMIRDNNLQDVISLLGPQSPEAVRLRMENAEIYIATSDKEEGWGAVINEAMNSGCTVVASHLMGSAPFLIQEGENGLIYKDGDLEELYRKVKFLLDNSHERINMGMNAYETIKSTWNASIASKRLLYLIKSLCENGKSSYTDGPCSPAYVLKESWKK